MLEPEHWKYSSAVDYAGGKGLLEIEFLDSIGTSYKLAPVRVII